MKKGFTLIELLVVISIIALLMGVLMPSLAKARSQAKGVVCLSRIKQMVLAAEAYAANHDGHYPIAIYRSDSRSYCWDFVSYSDSSGKLVVEPGILWQGDAAMEIQQCPEYKAGSNTASDPYTGYNYNTSYIGHGEGEGPNGETIDSEKVGSVRRPGECALFGDGEYSAGANKFMRAPLPSSKDTMNGRYAGTQGFRHSGKTNIAWADGHASLQIECYKDVYPDYNRNKIAERTGFLSSDNSAYDLQ